MGRHIRTIATDLQAGILVGVVLIPLAMGYGVIAGLGPVSGLYGAIAICLVSAVASNCRGLISGPNVLPAIVLAPVVAEHGSAAVLTTGILTGVILLVFAAARWGRIIAYVPHSLLAGFFTATGLTLIAMQVLPAIGLPTAAGGVWGNIVAWPGASVNVDALIVAGITIATGLVWPQRFARYAPGQFVALIAGVVVGTVWFPGAPTIGDIPRGLPELTTPVFDAAMVLPAFTIALLFAGYGLITAIRADTITGGRHHPNQLLAVYGVGTAVAGVLGGTLGGASVTTFLNIQAGGRTMIVGITATLIMLLALVVLPLDRIPSATLAGIIAVNGYQVIDWRFLWRLPRLPRGYAAVMLLTAVVAVLADFITAVILGLVMAWLVGAMRSERPELERLISVPLPNTAIWPDADPLESQVGLVVMPDWVSVSSAREMARILGGDLRQSRITIFDFRRVAYMDDTAAALTGQVIADRQVVIAGLHGSAAEAMAAFGNLAADSIVANVDEAKARIASWPTWTKPERGPTPT